MRTSAVRGPEGGMKTDARAKKAAGYPWCVDVWCIRVYTVVQTLVAYQYTLCTYGMYTAQT